MLPRPDACNGLITLQMQTAMESCVGKTLMSGAMGFALGGAFGLFMSSVRNPSSSYPFVSHLLLNSFDRLR